MAERQDGNGTVAEEYTGKFLVTFRAQAVQEGVALLGQLAGVRNLATTSDFINAAWDVAAIESAQGAVFENLGIAVIEAEEAAMLQLQASAADTESPILAVEPEMIMYALSELETRNATVPLTYLRGYRDGVDSIYQKLVAGEAVAPEPTVAEVYNNSPQAT